MLNTKYKTSLCRFWQNKEECPLKEKCHFAHGEKELRDKADPLPQNAPYIKPNTKQTGNGTTQPMGQQQPSVNYNYKTAKCKFFDEGTCRYGNKCIFAHGDMEMRTPKQNIDNFQLMQMQWQQQFYTQAQAQNEVLYYKRMLQHIILRFKQLHEKDEAAQKTLREAESLLGSNDIHNCGNKIQVIINENTDAQIKQKHTEIVEEAKNLGKNYVLDPSMMYNNQFGQMAFPGIQQPSGFM